MSSHKYLCRIAIVTVLAAAILTIAATTALAYNNPGLVNRTWYRLMPVGHAFSGDFPGDMNSFLPVVPAFTYVNEEGEEVHVPSRIVVTAYDEEEGAFRYFFVKNDRAHVRIKTNNRLSQPRVKPYGLGTDNTRVYVQAPSWAKFRDHQIDWLIGVIDF